MKRLLNTLSFFSAPELWMLLRGKFFKRFQNDRFQSLLEKKNKIDFLFVEGVRDLACTDDLLLTDHVAFDRQLKIALRIRGSDVYVFKQILIENEFRKVLEIFESTFGYRPNFIVDAGSNIGCTTLYFLAFNARAKVVAIEPSIDNVQLSKHNVTQNGFDENVIFLQKGLWYRDEQLAISSDFRDGLDWSKTTSPVKGGEIRSITPEQVYADLRSPTIDLFKIDIEGAEAGLFSADADTAWLDSVKMITIEIHHEFGVDQPIVARLKQHNFRILQHAELTIGINTKHET